jgi:hypothetical protein
MRILGTDYLQHFTPYSYNYLKLESTKDDVEVNPSDLIATNYDWTQTDIKKYYLN